MASSTPRGLTHKTPQWDQQLIIFSLSFWAIAFLASFFLFVCVRGNIDFVHTIQTISNARSSHLKSY